MKKENEEEYVVESQKEVEKEIFDFYETLYKNRDH